MSHIVFMKTIRMLILLYDPRHFVPGNNVFLSSSYIILCYYVIGTFDRMPVNDYFGYF